MSDKKNIDRLFQEKFKDYEVSPDPVVWKNIEKHLTKKKKKRIVPLWLRFAGAAAILFLITFMGNRFFSDRSPIREQPSNTIISDVEDKKTEDDSKEPVLKEENERLKTSVAKQNSKESETSRVVVNVPAQKNLSIGKETLITTSLQQNKSDEDKDSDIIKTAIESVAELDKIEVTPQDLIDINSDKSVVQEEVKDLDQDKIHLQEALVHENVDVDNENSKEKKWSVGSTIAPVYYNTLSNGSPIDASLSNNSKSTINSLSYGLKLNYKLTDKITLQSGINTVDLGYSTKNVATLLSSSLLDNSGSNINTNVDGVSVATVSTYSQNNETLGARTTFDVNGSLDQNMSYVEVPLEAKYNVLQRKFGINVVGGFSTYVLYQNSIQQTSFGKRSTLGEASNLNTLNFSGNLGLDFDYNFSKKLFINVSPMFKYQFNTFSEESGGFQPYYFGIYTGLNFRF